MNISTNQIDSYILVVAEADARDRLFGLHNSRIKFRNRTLNMPKHKEKVAFKIERLILTSLCTYILNI